MKGPFIEHSRKENYKDSRHVNGFLRWGWQLTTKGHKEIGESNEVIS